MSDAGSTSGMTVDDRERFALALEATDDGLWDWHLPTGRAYFSPRYYAMLGYEPGDLAASYEGWAGLVHPDDLPHAEASLHQHLASQSARFEIVFRLRSRGGDWRWILSRGRVAERDAAGQPLRLVGLHSDITELLGAISRDVTDQKQMEAALLRSARLTAAGRLAASVAHEINNPIQSIIGCLSLARREVDSGGSLDEYLEVAQAEIQRVARTVAQIRDLHRPFDGERLPVDVNPLLAQVLDLTRKKCQNGGVAVIWQPGESLPRPALVPDQLKQVCLNLVLNAVDAMPGGGALRVTTVATAQPRGVGIEVADNGTGIAPEVRPLIFEPFYSTRHEGLGLGLSISLGLVEQLGGHITVDSRPGEGSTFRVWLPA